MSANWIAKKCSRREFKRISTERRTKVVLAPQFQEWFVHFHHVQGRGGECASAAEPIFPLAVIAGATLIKHPGATLSQGEESAKIRFHSLSPAAYLLATFVRARRASDRRIIQCVKFSFPFLIFVTPYHYLPSRGFCLSFVSNPFIFYTKLRCRRCVVINAPVLSTVSSNPLFPLFVCVGAHWRFQSSSCWKLQK